MLPAQLLEKHYSGYTHGDVVTIQGGNNDATLTLSITEHLTLNRDKFTVIMRDLTNTKLTLKYENTDQFAFVEGTNLGDEPNGTQSVSDIVFLKSRTDGTDNIASLAIADGGSGYPAGCRILYHYNRRKWDRAGG